MQLHVILTVEAKDEYPGPDGNWGAGALPESWAATRRLNDVLADQTKHDDTIGWRVTAVREA